MLIAPISWLTLSIYRVDEILEASERGQFGYQGNEMFYLRQHDVTGCMQRLGYFK